MQSIGSVSICGTLIFWNENMEVAMRFIRTPFKIPHSSSYIAKTMKNTVHFSSLKDSWQSFFGCKTSLAHHFRLCLLWLRRLYIIGDICQRCNSQEVLEPGDEIAFWKGHRAEERDLGFNGEIKLFKPIAGVQPAGISVGVQVGKILKYFSTDG